MHHPAKGRGGGPEPKDDSPVSATTTLRERRPPATLLEQTAARYAAALDVAAEDLLGWEAVATLKRAFHS